MKKIALFLAALGLSFQTISAEPLPLVTPGSQASLPMLVMSQAGKAHVYWLEKDAAGVSSLYLAPTKSDGSFGEKQLIHASANLSGGRLAKPIVMQKKSGEWVAIFSYRHVVEEAPAPGKRPARGNSLMFTSSQDQGKTWSAIQPVHKENKPNVVRGFFDATLLPTDEVAVAWLNDIEGKAHERDLRLVTTKQGKFQTEQVVDDFTCDCCPVRLQVNTAGDFSIYYRENENNIRDIVRITSKDGGKSFGKAEKVYVDQWEVKGCPHSGPTSATWGKEALVSWFSGTPTEPGLRLTTHSGQKLDVITGKGAKSPFILTKKGQGLIVWEESQVVNGQDQFVIGYKRIDAQGKVSDPVFIQTAGSANNPTAAWTARGVVIAFEEKVGDQPSTIQIEKIVL